MNQTANRFETIHNGLPKAFGGELPAGNIRTENADFRVEEVLPFEPAGEGEHLFLYIEKIACNTDWVIKQLKKVFGLSSREIGYAGKKDRYSISTQWFSLHLPGKQVEAKLIESDSIKIIRCERHNKKLRVGSIKENQFKIRVRELASPINPEIVEQIKKNGFPNYFGSQRFGRKFSNLERAEELLVAGKKIKNRNLKGLVLSSARSFLFNLQLAERIKQNNWLTIVEGDCVNLNASHSYFTLKAPSEEEQQRIDAGDTHLCGWLPGKQASDAVGSALKLEQQSIRNYGDWLQGLTQFKLDSKRRAYRVFAKDFVLQQSDRQAFLSFSLPSGSFATSLLNELIDCRDSANHHRSEEKAEQLIKEEI